MAQRREEAAGELSLKREQDQRPVRMSGGCEPAYDQNGMFIGLQKTPDVLYDPNIDRARHRPAGRRGIADDPRAIAVRNNAG